MRKLILVSAIFITPMLLSGCDSDKSRKERCTQLQNEDAKARWGKGERKLDEIRKEWDGLKCEQSDIIQG